MAEKIELFEVDIDFNALTKKAADAAKTIEDLKNQANFFKKAIKEGNNEIEEYSDSLAEMRKNGQQNTKEYKTAAKNLEVLNKQQESNRTKLETLNSNIREQNNNYKSLKKSTDAYNKAASDQLGIVTKTDGSIKGLEAALRNNNLAYRKLTKEQRENEEIGGKLLTTIQEQDKEYKDLQKSIGTTAVDVGNYKGQIGELLDENNALSKSFEGSIRQIPIIGNLLANAYKGLLNYAAGQRAALAATTGMNKGLKLFKLALIGTGIGAFVVILGSLVTYLSSTQEGIDFVKQSTSALGAVMDVLKDRLILAFEGFKLLFSGKLSAAADKFGESIKNLTTEIKEEASAAYDLQEALIAIEKQEARLAVAKANTRAEVEKLKFAAEDASNSLQERSEAAAKAIQIEQDLLDQGIALLEKKKDVLIEQNELGTSTEEDLQRVRDIEIELANLQQESVTKQIELNNKLNTFRKESAANELARQESIVASNLETMNKELELFIINNESKVENAEEVNEELVQRETDRLETIRQKKLEILEAERLDELDHQIALAEIDKEFIQAKQELDLLLREQEKERLLLEQEAEAEAYQNKLELLRARGATEYQIKLQQLQENLNKELALYGKDAQAKAAIEAKYQDEVAKLDASVTDAKLANAATVADQVSGLLGQQSATGKLAALAQASINVAQGVTKAIAQGGIAGIATGATVALAGAKQISQIKSFEKGGNISAMTLGGNRHSEGGTKFQGSDGTQFEAEKDEGIYIMKRNAHQAFLPIMSRINQQYGGVALNTPSNYLAQGGSPVRGATTPSGSTVDYAKLGQVFTSAVKSLRVVASIEEIQSVGSQRMEIIEGASR